MRIIVKLADSISHFRSTGMSPPNKADLNVLRKFVHRKFFRFERNLVCR